MVMLGQLLLLVTVVVMSTVPGTLCGTEVPHTIASMTLVFAPEVTVKVVGAVAQETPPAVFAVRTTVSVAPAAVARQRDDPRTRSRCDQKC